MRQELLERGSLRTIASFKRPKFTHDPVRSQFGKHIELRPARRLGPPVGEIDDSSLPGSLDCRMRIINKARQPL
jgi:hypothetical protein